MSGAVLRPAWSVQEWQEDATPLRELPGWNFPGNDLKKYACHDVQQAHALAAREVGTDAERCAVFNADSGLLIIKGSASKYLPALKGETSSAHTTFYNAGTQPLVDSDVAELSAPEVWLPRWAYACATHAEKTKVLSQVRVARPARSP